MRVVSVITYVCCLFISISSFSQVTRYWIGSAVTKNWNNTLNWSISSGGATGASVPGVNDRVIFNNLGNINCIIDVSNLAIESISLSGYTAAIDLNGNNVSISGATNASIINAPAGGITIKSSIGSPTFSVGGNNNFTFGGSGTATFTSVSVTIVLGGTATCTVAHATFGSTVNFKAPHIMLNGATFNGSTTLEKSDAVGQLDDYGLGGNTFSGTTSITNSSRKYLATATSTGDVFNGAVTFTSSGTAASIIYVAHSYPTAFNNTIMVSCTGTGGGINFGYNVGGVSTIASGKSITTGGSGFSVGSLFLGGLIYPDNFNLTLNGTAMLCLGPSYSYGEPSTFNGNVTVSSPRITLNKSTFNGTLSATKTGATDDFSLGGNTFQSTTQIFNSSDAAFCFAATTDGSPDAFNGDLALINNGGSAGYIYMAHTIGGSFFNGNLTVSNSGGGIYFGYNPTGTSFLASGRTISVGSFSTGRLRLNQFNQLGSTAQIITLTGSGQIDFGSQSSFNGKVTATAPTITFNNVTFNGDVDITSSGFPTLASSTFNGSLSVLTKTSSSSATDTWAGGNTFGDNPIDSILFLNNSGWGIQFASTAGDTFKGKVGFDAASFGSIQPAYNQTSTFESNITVKGATGITFGTGTGVVSFTSGNNQYIYKSGSNNPTFRRISADKTSGIVYLKTKSTITSSATFNTGIIQTDYTNLLVFNNGSTVSAANDASHVNGPVQKIGTAVFDFPVGNGTSYRPIGLASVAGSSNTFTGKYIKSAPSNSSSLASSINHIGTCEYWSLDRVSGTANVKVKLSWKSSICNPTGPYVDDLTKLLVSGYDGSMWQDLGNGSTTGSAGIGSSGTITSLFSPSVYGYFTLASTDGILNPLPIELTDFKCELGDQGVMLSWVTRSEFDNDKFEILKSVDGINFFKIGETKGVGTSTVVNKYEFLDRVFPFGLVYYRLSQVDFDGTNSLSKVISIIGHGEQKAFSIYPNPTTGQVFLSDTYSGFIYNVHGNAIGTFTSTGELDFSKMGPGIYFVKNNLSQVKIVIVN